MRRNGWLLWLLTLSGALGSLWMVFHFSKPKTWQVPADNLNYSWLEYPDADGGLEKVCNCTAILEGDREAVAQAKLLTITKDFNLHYQIPDDHYIKAAQDCRKFKLSGKYQTFPLSKEEEDFPLAYSIVVHHKVQNFERLLRAIYTPQNIYCVHVDKKSQASVLSAIEAIASCFPNVFLVSHAETVVYSAWSRVQADLNCMADLYNASTKWKYFINLCGQDFPLKTNLQMVRTLRSLKGGNSLESEKLPDAKKWRVTFVYKIVGEKLQKTSKKKTPPPFNLPILSGNAYIVVSRGFVRSVLEDSRIQVLIEWAKDTFSPDEFLWATIQRIPGVPGSKWLNPKHDMSDLNAVSRLVKWRLHEGQQDSLEAAYPKCEGNHIRDICVYGAGDLHWLVQQHHFFANKFDAYNDPIPVYCLEKYLRQQALAEPH
ncbi:beta-1,3-galactosyl-O-glycosyl-glycoprotein beta-1,6-N-acetylglucosaminyltransferase [Salarias fasciatus]|uniref:Glucosaminyl (N-acetyl) transferase 3, mucin type n=1 Tax=Salarias fasciatus TaxID=181472 RepID=A0A672HDY3_SALFA|nr:beta-1,3-galactosyl-O-glycosyl-glycoprotein beta-1,6-N-acetylglucosaminyltransferase [Salarias fasciatus]